MKKPYDKPALLRRDNLSGISSGKVSVSVSDARVKTDITRIGTAANGVPLYTWRYHGQPEVWQGVLAQDVLKVDPEAVGHSDDGFLTVDYPRLGLKAQRLS